MSALSVGMTALALLTAKGVASIFASYDAELLNITTRALRLYSISYFFAGINIFGSNLFAALNDGKTAGILSGLRIFVFQMLAIFVLPLIFGSDGIWLAMFAAESCVFIITLIVLSKGRARYSYLFFQQRKRLHISLHLSTHFHKLLQKILERFSVPASSLSFVF